MNGAGASVPDHGSSHRVVLDADEQEAMDHLLAFMEIVSRRWQLAANSGELTAAIHVLQGFVIQHMLTRLEPGEWGDWWRQADA